MTRPGAQHLRRSKRALARYARRLGLRSTPPAAASPPRALKIPKRSIPLPSAAGWDLQGIHEAWATFSIDGSPPGELDPYWAESSGRVLHTWGLVRDETGRCLELGSNPFFTTWMLRNFTSLDVSQANYFGASGNAVQVLNWRDPAGADHSWEMPMALFNMEEDQFPYADDSFDVVLFGEIIEHLLMDPLHPLREIHRILKPGGELVLTTPNVGRLENIFALVEGRNLYDPYSGFGPYGRHNREFTPHEVYRLLDFAGFSTSQIFTEDSRAWDRGPFAAIESALADVLAGPRSFDLGQYVFAVAEATHDPRHGWPETFFRSREAGDLVPWE